MSDVNSKRTIITLCGSSRFVDVMAVCAWLIERDEQAIALTLHLLPVWYAGGLPDDHLAEHENCATTMDEIHMKKVELADEAFVVSHGDYHRRQLLIHAVKTICTDMAQTILQSPPLPLEMKEEDKFAPHLVKEREIAVKEIRKQQALIESIEKA